MKYMTILALILSALGCSNKSDQFSNAKAVNTSLKKARPSETFLRLFAARIEKRDINDFMFLTPPELDLDFASNYQQVDSSADALSRYTQKNPVIPIKTPTAKKPITFVVIPGIFGELLSEFPLKNAFSTEGSLFYQKNIAKLRNITDVEYDVFEHKHQSKSLDKLVSLGDIAESKIQFVGLKAELGSLETVGLARNSALIYHRRLSKLFAQLQDRSDIYFIGYSRGLPVGLELAKIARRSDEEYASRIKGVVGLGGVFAGSEFIDNLFDVDSSSFDSQALEIIQELSEELEIPEDGFVFKNKRWKTYLKNTGAWFEAAEKLSKIELQSIEELRLERSLRGERLGLGRLDSQESSRPLLELLFKTFRLDRPFRDYSKNVSAFKRFIEQGVIGLNELSSNSRVDWWHRNQLPEDIALFSIAGSMPARTQKDLSPSLELPGFHKESTDFNFLLRPRFYEVAAWKSFDLNDGLVAYPGARYWPELGGNYEHHFLGVMATHHAGLAVPYLLKDKPKIGDNPFPRKEMVLSIADYIRAIR